MDHLQKIKSNFAYSEDKSYVYGRLSDGNKVQDKEEAKVRTDAFYNTEEDIMLEFGMEKFYFILAGILWQIENNVVDPELAYEAYLDLEDFNTNKYDSLILKSELKIVKQDAKKVYDYIIKHKLHE